jgi:hypothetical protein
MTVDLELKVLSTRQSGAVTKVILGKVTIRVIIFRAWRPTASQENLSDEYRRSAADSYGTARL